MSARSSVTRNLVLAALFAALTGVCSQISIPLTVPVNLALFAVHLCAALLGAKWGTLSMVCYVLLGLIGVPVFSNFGSGPAKLFGITGGYILGYVLCAAIVGCLSRRLKFGHQAVNLCVSMVIGVIVCYAFGTAWFAFLDTNSRGVMAILGICVFPFLPGDAVKIALAVLLTLRLQKPMKQLGFSL